MARVLVAGHEYFAKLMVENLGAAGGANRYARLGAINGVRGRMRGMAAILRSDVLYSIGGGVARSRVIDFALLSRKTVVMHWVGTDVLEARDAVARRETDKNAMTRVTHWCEVPWIQNELKELGIAAEIVPIAALDAAPTGELSLPSVFSVLSYVREGREVFYGMNDLVRLAEDFPAVPVRIAGISHYDRTLPPNVTLLGWKADMRDEYLNSVLYLRLPEHDGLSFSVLEALSYGRYVGYSYEYPQTILVDSYMRLKDVIKDLAGKFKEGSLRAHTAGAEFVKTHFARAAVLRTLDTKLARESHAN
jgi:hypothetical protein